MAYRFELRQPVEAEFRRIALEQADRVIRELTADGKHGPSVHESRKGLKRLRALLRLARPGLPEATFAALNIGLRDTGRLLSGERDRQVLLDTAAKIEAGMGRKTTKTFARVRAELDQPAKKGGRNGQSPEVRAIEAISSMRKELARLDLEPPAFATLQRGLERGYRRGRRLLKRAYREPADEAFHELRKSVQLQWRHMALLSRAWPALFTARVEAARTLSQILGDDHDLAVFAAFVRALPRSVVSVADRRAILDRCTADQRGLRALAEPLCAQLYAERAGRFVKRIGMLWAAAEDAAGVAAKLAEPPRRKRPASARRKPAPRRGNVAQAATRPA